MQASSHGAHIRQRNERGLQRCPKRAQNNHGGDGNLHVYVLKLVRRYGREHVLTGVMHPSHSHPSIPITNHRYVINNE
jgi:hypothetical protein